MHGIGKALWLATAYAIDKAALVGVDEVVKCWVPQVCKV